MARLHHREPPQGGTPNVSGLTGWALSSLCNTKLSTPIGVPLVGLIGAAVARLRPTGMARALFVTAIAQAMVLAAAVILLITRNPQVASWTPPEWRGIGGNAFCAMLFAGSGLLFRKAGRGESATGNPPPTDS